MKSFVFFASVLAGLTPVAAASAHISLEQGGTHQSRYGDASIKDGPCGVKDGKRGTHIYTYAPGETITVKLVEYISHPSYFRFAFDNDGDDDFKEPASIKPIDPSRPCPINPGDKCGASDFNNSPTVLMDDLDPHLGGANGQSYTWQVKLPDVECDNCTLQVIQVMEDNVFHGDFNPVAGDPNDPFYVADIYHQCIDLVLKPGGGTNPSNGGASNTDAGGTNPSNGGASTSSSGGATNGASGGEASANGGTSSLDNPGGGGASGSGPSGSSGAFGSGTGGDAAAAPSNSSGSCSVGLSERRSAPSGFASLGLGVAVLARLRRRSRAAR